MSQRKLFLRESSGLVKNASLKDLVMLNVANMGAGLAVFEGISPYVVQGSLLWLASLITFLITLPLVFTYTYLLLKMPRTGGDYVWISRKLNGAIGSIMGVAFAFNMPPYFALSAFFSVASINLVFLELGTLQHISSLTYLANNVFVNPYGVLTLSQELLFYALAAISFLIIILVNIFRPKWGFTLTTILGIISSLTLIIAMIVVAVNIPDFHQRIPQFLTTFNITGTITPFHFSLPATLYMVPFFMSYAYIWLYAGPAVAGEAKEGSLKLNLILGSVLTFIMITFPFLIMDLAAGPAFNLAYYPSFTYNFWSVAIYLASNPIIQWILGIGLIAWNYFIMAFGVVVFARYIFAFSFDRLFPAIFAKLNKYSSPVYAHILDLIATLVFLALPLISPSGALALYSYTPLAVAYLFIVSLAGIKVGLNDNNKKLLVMSIISAIIMAVVEAELLIPSNNYSFSVVSSSGVNWIATAYIISLIGLGVISYFLARYYRMKKEGIDISLIYKEIPPE
ncbi:APC family permease [Sulfurisphaera ohwakuensis]|uniref:APC family permease n=1 Tax=Sulfurisphaera ohwakuensis TaxID=69656 RepID=UPI0036F2E6F8